MMTNLFLTLLLLAGQPGPGVGDRANPDRFRAVTPVTDKFILPPKLRDCRTKEEADAAVEAKRAGEFEKCDPEPFIRAR
jgi:hypothetical protein